jgi:1-acyl-sn-glycerol-3-phosphate acyltransferase
VNEPPAIAPPAATTAPPAGALPPGALNNSFFWPTWAAVRLMLRGWFRLRIEGALPATGACVLAANHASFLDPVLVCAAARRRVVFLMTEVVWRSPALNWFYRWNQTIPLAARGGNRDALRAAHSVLEQGRVLGIFPEGGLSRDGLPMMGNPGAVSIVQYGDVPVVPVGIVGAHEALPPGGAFPRPRRITVRFGEAIPAVELAGHGSGHRRERMLAATRLIMARIAALTGHEPREAELRRRRAT